jgi:hypothetical protein
LSTVVAGRSWRSATCSRQVASSRAIARADGESELTRGSRVDLAHVADRLEVAAFLQRPVHAAVAAQPALELRREVEQVKHVLARVCELLRVERAAVPARVARGLLDAHAEHLAQERVVARLRGQPGEAGRDLGVEDTRHLGGGTAAQQRDVLAPRVHDHLDVRVCEEPGERSEIGRFVERIEHDHLKPLFVADDDLDHTQQRAVAALADELGIDAEAPDRSHALAKRAQRH